MINNMFGNLFGQSMSNNLGQNISGAVGAQNPYMNQGMAAQNNAAYQAQQRAYTAAARPEWMFNGKAMSITEFADTVYGDTPQRTMFLLKYSDKEKK